MLSNSKLPVEPDKIVGFLKQTFSLKEISQKILYQQVISQAAAERGITVNPKEIEAEADRQRREKQLEKAADTLAWLADQMVTPDDWEVGIRD